MSKTFKTKLFKEEKNDIRKVGCSEKGKKIKSNKGQTVDPVKLEDIRKLFKFFEKENNVKIYAAIKIQLNTGLRISDVLEMTFNEVEAERLKEKKTQKYKKVKFNTNCLEAIEKLKKYYKNNKIGDYNKGYIFKATRNTEEPLSYQTFSYHIKKAKTKLNIKYPFHSHSFRKTWAKATYNETKDVARVMRLLNHSNQAVTLRYIGIELEELEDLSNKIRF